MSVETLGVVLKIKKGIFSYLYFQNCVNRVTPMTKKIPLFKIKLTLKIWIILNQKM